MKAVVYDRFGPPDVLELADVPKPVPRAGEILIRTRATTVTAGDWRVRSLDVPRGFKFASRLMFGPFWPRQRILGSELAGDVVAVGDGVARFAVGDAVFVYSGAMGCYVEYKCMPEDGAVAPKPANLDYGEAAALPFGGSTALHFLQRAKLSAGEKVLVNGASGGVGTAAVQLARHFGAEVTGVCSAANADLVRSLGAGRVVDYAREDFTQTAERYDVIVDTVGTAPYSRVKGSLADGGRLLVVSGGLADLLLAPWITLVTSTKVVAGPATASPGHLPYLAELAESGAFKPFIDRTYPVDEIVEAHRYIDTRRKRGNVVIEWA